MDAKRLDEIEQRADAADKGEWMAVDYGRDDSWIVVNGGPGDPAVADCNYWSMKRKANAAFIAASRADVPDLVAEVRRLVKALSDIRKHHHIAAGSGYAMSATGRMLDRALEGYEVKP